MITLGEYASGEGHGVRHYPRTGRWRRAHAVVRVFYQAASATRGGGCQFRVWQAIEIAAPGFGLEVTQLAFRDSADDIESAVVAFGDAPEGAG